MLLSGKYASVDFFSVVLNSEEVSQTRMEALALIHSKGISWDFDEALEAAQWASYDQFKWVIEHSSNASDARPLVGPRILEWYLRFNLRAEPKMLEYLFSIGCEISKEALLEACFMLNIMEALD